MKPLILQPLDTCSGIYGIYIDGELVYIGKTIRSFRERFKQHKRLIEFPDESETQYDMYYELATAKAQGKSVYLEPLFVVETADYNSLYNLTNRDIESAEFALISVLKPRLNVCGMKKAYKYSN